MCWLLLHHCTQGPLEEWIDMVSQAYRVREQGTGSEIEEEARLLDETDAEVGRA